MKTRWFGWLLGTAVWAGCIIDVPPSIPDAPSSRSVVVAATATEVSGDCESACPAARPEETLVVCHPTRVREELAQHRERLDEPKSDHWIVCDYDRHDE